MTHQELEAAALAALCHSAEIVATFGAQFARADDPHRYASLPREFDGGKARRRLALDYLADGKIRVTLLFIGTQGGEERVAELFSTLVQGPVDEVKQ